MLKKYRYKILFLISLIAVGVVSQLSGMFDPGKIITIAREYADQWWLLILLVLLQMILFTFALAGSSFLWVAAALYAPLTASLVLAFGAALGGISAYFFSQRLTDEWVHKVESSRAYLLLQKHDNFFTLLALRIMPAFPHSVINYSSGILNVNIVAFISASFIGVGIKSYVFVTVIQQAASSGSIYDLLDLSVLAPLILISAVLFVGVLIVNKKK